MEILSWVTLQVILPFSPAVVQKLTIKLKDKRHSFRFFFLEIKPKDCSGRMENSSRQTENSSYPFPLCSAKRLFKISSSYIKLIFLCEDKNFEPGPISHITRQRYFCIVLILRLILFKNFHYIWNFYKLNTNIQKS